MPLHRQVAGRAAALLDPQALPPVGSPERDEVRLDACTDVVVGDEPDVAEPGW